MRFGFLSAVAVAGVLFGGTFLTGSSVDRAEAQTEQDGLVNVVVEDSLNEVIVLEIEDVNVGVAANIAANICGVKVGPVAVLGNAVDRSGNSEVVCDSGPLDVTLVQN